MTWWRRWRVGSGTSTSEVSRICADLDAEVAAFRDRLPGVPVRVLGCDVLQGEDRRDRRGRGSRVTAQAVVIATGMSAGGRREVLGFKVGDSESGVF